MHQALAGADRLLLLLLPCRQDARRKEEEERKRQEEAVARRRKEEEESEVGGRGMQRSIAQRNVPSMSGVLRSGIAIACEHVLVVWLAGCIYGCIYAAGPGVMRTANLHGYLWSPHADTCCAMHSVPDTQEEEEDRELYPGGHSAAELAGVKVRSRAQQDVAGGLFGGLRGACVVVCEWLGEGG